MKRIMLWASLAASIQAIVISNLHYYFEALALFYLFKNLEKPLWLH